MTTPKPLSKEQASEKVHEIYDNMEKAFGRMPNIFAVMAQKPEVLKKFLPFYQEVTGEGRVEGKYKELAYLKTSQVNGCKY